MLKSKDEEWGVRLADIRLPRAWPLPVMVALLLARRQQSRALRGIERTSKDLGEITAQRWREGDARADRLIALTATLTRLTWVLLAVTVVTLVVNVVILVSA
jgi:hypothetical protein